MTKPIIGITQLTDDPANLYTKRIKECGGQPQIINLRRPKDLNLGNQLGGLLLTGGDETNQPYPQDACDTLANDKLKSKRDLPEFSLLDQALNLHLPVLAICRGMHVLNIALGGNLMLNIPNHRSIDSEKPRIHEIFVPPGSRLTSIIGVGGFMKTNSLHSSGLTLKEKAPGLLVSAFSLKDGIIEALDMPSREHRWVIGVQWSPERKKEVPGNHQRLFSSFVEAAHRTRG